MEQSKVSLLRRYENGYEAHIIDNHPHGKIYRDVHNPLDIVAFPEESVMLLTKDGVVVMFLNTISDMNEIEQKMNLKRII